MKVLIVDDSPPMRSMIRQFLPAASLEVRECDDGIYALSAYADFLPDLVLMDWQMKQMGGLTATKEILRFFPKAYILLVSQYDDAELRKTAFEIGVRDFISKDDLKKLREIFPAAAF